MTPEREKEIRNKFKKEDDNSFGADCIRELLAEIDYWNDLNEKEACLVNRADVTKLKSEIDRLRVQINEREITNQKLTTELMEIQPLLEERYKLLAFLESRNLLFEAHAFIRGEK